MKEKTVGKEIAWFKQIPVWLLCTVAVVIIISGYVFSVTGDYIDRSLLRIKGWQS